MALLSEEEGYIATKSLNRRRRQTNNSKRTTLLILNSVLFIQEPLGTLSIYEGESSSKKSDCHNNNTFFSFFFLFLCTAVYSNEAPSSSIDSSINHQQHSSVQEDRITPTTLQESLDQQAADTLFSYQQQRCPKYMSPRRCRPARETPRRAARPTRTPMLSTPTRAPRSQRKSPPCPSEVSAKSVSRSSCGARSSRSTSP